MNTKVIAEYPDNNFEVSLYDRTVGVELCYPRIEGHPDTVEVGLMDVRAADSIQVSYDFERDGWSIKQASRFSWTQEEAKAGNTDEDWQEVAFVEAWARKVPDEWDDDYVAPIDNPD